MGRSVGRMITFNDAIYMVNNEGFDAWETIPSSNQVMKRSAIEYYLKVDTSYMSAYTMNQAVPYNKIVKAQVSGNAPVITSTEAPLDVENTSYSFQVQATNSPTSWSATNMPSGLTINNNGLISGTAPAFGEYSVSVTATNAFGSNTKAILIRTTKHLNGGGLWYSTTAAGYCSSPASGQYFYNATSLDQSTIIYNQDETKAAAGYYGLINDGTHFYFNGNVGISLVGECNTTTLTISPTSVNRTSASGSFTVTVTSNTTWVVSESLSWVSYTGASLTGNDTFTVTVTANTGVQRSGNITIRTTDSSIIRTLSITQAAGTSSATAVQLAQGFDGLGACEDAAYGYVSTYYITGTSWSSATKLWSNSAGTTAAAAGYYSDGQAWRYWDPRNGSFSSNGFCMIN